MKVIGSSCSPSKNGNTDILVKEALSAAKKAGADIEFITVVGKDISGCQGCQTCLSTGECKIQDDMQPIIQAMIDANGIIFDTPVYFAMVISQAKAVIDRTYSLLFTKKLKNKVGAPVVATHRIGGSQVLSQLEFWFTNQRMLLAGAVIGYGYEKGEVKTGVGAWSSSALDESSAVGRSVVRLIRQPYNE